MRCPKCQTEDCVHAIAEKRSPKRGKPGCPFCRGAGTIVDAHGFFTCVCVRYGPTTG